MLGDKTLALFLWLLKMSSNVPVYMRRWIWLIKFDDKIAPPLCLKGQLRLWAMPHESKVNPVEETIGTDLALKCSFLILCSKPINFEANLRWVVITTVKYTCSFHRQILAWTSFSPKTLIFHYHTPLRNNKRIGWLRQLVVSYREFHFQPLV